MENHQDNRTVFQRGVDANAICQALAKYFKEHPEVKIDLMNLASDMTWVCKYLDDPKYNPQYESTGLMDMLMSIDEGGHTTTAFYFTEKSPMLWVDSYAAKFIRPVFTKVGMGLQCEWVEISEKEARDFVSRWNHLLAFNQILQNNSQ